MKTPTLLLTLPLLCASSLSATAAVTAVGVITDDAGGEITSWDITTVPKTLDADGDNSYGTWAGEWVGVINNNTPNVSFVSIGTGNGVVGPFGGYDVVSNGGGGTATVRTTTGSDISNVITYTLNNITDLAASNGIRAGLFVDGLDGPQFTGTSYSLEHLRGGSSLGLATHSLTPNGTGAAGVTTLDGLFFDLSGLASGDQIRFSTAGTGFATFQGVSFDVIVPEPSRAMLLAMGLFAFLLRRTRR